MQPMFEPHFSEGSHGFRPGRGAHGAIKAAQRQAREGREWVVDMDITALLPASLKKSGWLSRCARLDRVSHDILMTQVSRVVRDKRMRQLIGRFLRAGSSCQEDAKSAVKRARRKAGRCHRWPTSTWTSSTGDRTPRIEARPLRRRLQHLREQPACCAAGAGSHQPVDRPTSQAGGQCGEERCRESPGAQVPGLHPHRRPSRGLKTR